jgi:cytochrome b561
VTAQYLILAVLLAATLNHANRFVRAAGTLLAAVGLAFIILSIWLADTDGTFAALPDGLLNQRAIVLNVQGGIATVAAVFLLWATWRQLRRRGVSPITWRNTGTAFGLVSRTAHWASATLILCMVPIGLFMVVLPPGAPGRDVFVAVHQTLGVTILALVLLRLLWIVRSPAPALPVDLQRWERRFARTLHGVLYTVILGLPITGLLLNLSQGGPIDIYGWVVTRPAASVPGGASPWGVLHGQVLPLVFYVIIALHLAGVVKHHFVSGRTGDIRRMVR